eukprot:Clim_evm94s134 gene=Clim_evmTU94s134
MVVARILVLMFVGFATLASSLEHRDAGVSPYLEDADHESVLDMAPLTTGAVCKDNGTCYNGGLCVHEATDSTPDKTCHCPLEYQGGECKDLLCSHALGKKPEEHIDPTTLLCRCQDGWLGPTCGVCTDDHLCEIDHGGDYKTTCNKSFQTYSYRTAFCNVTTEGVADATHTQTRVQLSYDWRNNTSTYKTGHFTFFAYDENKWKSLFACGYEQCEQQRDENKKEDVIYNCHNAQCKLNCEVGSFRQCTFLLSAIVKQVKGDMNMVCNDKTFECDIHAKILDKFFNGVKLDCSPEGKDSPFGTGECVDDTSQKLRFKNLEHPDVFMLLAAIVTCLVLGGTLAILVGLYFYSRELKNTILSVEYNDLAMHAEAHSNEVYRVNLSFENVNYAISRRNILRSVTGVCKSGEIMAIMGASGAGKSTFMDIMAMKSKRGKVGGEILANGLPRDRTFKRLIGFVDQSDSLMGTLTVRESLTYSAMLRLPAVWPTGLKLSRVEWVMEQLKISHIAESYIGTTFRRGISGGEKRRVSIGMELVIQPSVLFCDEPTSGLDSYNAFVVMECLQTLARRCGTSVIVTIHQPRSNIYQLFDRLMILADGDQVYNGLAADALDYFTSIGHECPSGYNPADFFIDLVTMYSSGHGVNGFTTAISEPSTPTSRFSAEDSSDVALNSLWPGAATVASSRRINDLRDSFVQSQAYQQLVAEVHMAKGQREFRDPMEPIAPATKNIRFGRQCIILCYRALLNIVRNPFLLVGHLSLSIILGLVVGGFYYQLQLENLEAIQNRMGALLIICAFLGFGSMSSLEMFHSERGLYMHERSNRFYGPSAFFVSKMFFDLVPLRMVPPLIMGTICYWMIGFRHDTIDHFFYFLLILMLVNVAATSLCMVIGVSAKRMSMAIEVAALSLLFSLMLTGIFNNHKTMNPYVAWLRYLSFFNYGYEALCVNELDGVELKGSILKSASFHVNARLILDQLGLEADNFFKDLAVLVLYSFIMLTVAFLALKYYVRERR